MHVFVLLQALGEPGVVEAPGCVGPVRVEQLDFVGVLEAYFAAVLLPEEGADNGLRLSPEGVPRDVVGDSEEDERVQESAEAGVGGFGAADEGVRGGHDGRSYGEFAGVLVRC